jgi:hypothetical protein
VREVRGQVGLWSLRGNVIPLGHEPTGGEFRQEGKVDSVLREEPTSEAFPSPNLPQGSIAALEEMEGGVSYSVERLD